MADLFISSSNKTGSRTWILFLITIVTIIWAFGGPMQGDNKVTVPTAPQMKNLEKIMMEGPSDASLTAWEKPAKKLKKLLNIDSTGAKGLMDEMDELRVSSPSAEARETAELIPDDAPFYERALKELAFERYDKAEQLLKKAVKEDNEYNMLMSLGREAMLSGNYRVAVFRFNSALDMRPSSLELIKKNALALYAMRDTDLRQEFTQKTVNLLKIKLGDQALVAGAFAYNLGTLELMDNRRKSGEALYWLAMNLFNDMLGPNDQKTRKTYILLLSLYQAEGRDREEDTLRRWMEKEQEKAEEEEGSGILNLF